MRLGMRSIVDGLASVAMMAASGAIIWATLANPSTRIPSPRPPAVPVSTDVPDTPLSIAGAQLRVAQRLQ